MHPVFPALLLAFAGAPASGAARIPAWSATGISTGNEAVVRAGLGGALPPAAAGLGGALPPAAAGRVGALSPVAADLGGALPPAAAGRGAAAGDLREGAAAAPAAVVSVERVFGRAGHSAFTGICRFAGRLYICFREGSGHVPGLDGTVRVIVSDDGLNWRSAALLDEEGVDLRDPKLSVTPGGRLMVLMGGSFYEGGRLLKMSPRVSFFKGAACEGFSPPVPVELPEGIETGGGWLWRVTWHGDKGYGVLYRTGEPDWGLVLLSTRDGRSYRKVADLAVPGKANETTLRFLAGGTMVALIRREGGDKRGMVGVSSPPYTEWSFSKLPVRLGGPDFVPLPDGTLLGGSRGGCEGGKYNTSLFRFGTDGSFTLLLTLPGGGDTGYPGLIVEGEKVLVSYYSSHEGKAAIYLARLRLKALLEAGR